MSERAVRQVGRDAAMANFAGEFLRFMAVGAVATASHLAALWFFLRLVAPPPSAPSTLNTLIGSAIGAFIGAVVGYVLNRRYTFAVRPQFMTGLVKYVAGSAASFVLNLGLMAIFLHLGLSAMPAQILTIAILATFNFAVARLIVFRA